MSEWLSERVSERASKRASKQASKQAKLYLTSVNYETGNISTTQCYLPTMTFQVINLIIPINLNSDIFYKHLFIYRGSQHAYCILMFTSNSKHDSDIPG